jgi:hypothetical protein
LSTLSFISLSSEAPRRDLIKEIIKGSFWSYDFPDKLLEFLNIEPDS